MTQAIATAPATAPEDDEDDNEQLFKEPLRIDPHNVKFDMVGFDNRYAMVRLPLGVIADDLNGNTSLWERVQVNSSTALKKFDRVLIISYDESWVAEALVAEASHGRVTLSKPRISVFPERNERLLNDGKYRVAWAGNGYTVHRCSDNFKVSGPHANIPLAERALAQMYPQPAQFR